MQLQKIKFMQFLYTHSNQCILSLSLSYQLFLLTDHEYFLLTSFQNKASTNLNQHIPNL